MPIFDNKNRKPGEPFERFGQVVSNTLGNLGMNIPFDAARTLGFNIPINEWMPTALTYKPQSLKENVIELSKNVAVTTAAELGGQFVSGAIKGVNTLYRNIANKTDNFNNIYKLNPNAFKINSEAYYRGISKEGYKDILESQIVKSKKQHAYPNPYFSKGVIGEKYSKGYILELKNEPMKGVGSFPKGDLIQTPENIIKIDNPNLKIYKKNIWKGYKELPKK